MPGGREELDVAEGDVTVAVEAAPTGVADLDGWVTVPQAADISATAASHWSFTLWPSGHRGRERPHTATYAQRAAGVTSTDQPAGRASPRREPPRSTLRHELFVTKYPHAKGSCPSQRASPRAIPSQSADRLAGPAQIGGWRVERFLMHRVGWTGPRQRRRWYPPASLSAADAGGRGPRTRPLARRSYRRGVVSDLEWQPRRRSRPWWVAAPGCLVLLVVAALFVVFGFSIDNISFFQDGLLTASVASIVVWLYALPILSLGRPLRLVPRAVRENPLPGAVRWWGFGCSMWDAYSWLLVTPNASGLVRPWLTPASYALVLGAAIHGCNRGSIAPSQTGLVARLQRRWAVSLHATRSWRSSAPAAAPGLPLEDPHSSRRSSAGVSLPHGPGTWRSPHRTPRDRRTQHRPHRRH